MTHQAIIDRWDSLTPAQRDAWVQEVVFPELGEKASDYRNDCPTCGYDGLWNGSGWGDAQPYTQHPAAAWLVVERMQELNFTWAVGRGGRGKHWARFATVRQWEIRADEDVRETNEDTAAEAICLAALLALDRFVLRS